MHESALAALVQNVDSGILVEDAERHVRFANEAFCRLFSIPVAPAALVGTDCRGAAQASAGLFLDPDGFLSRIDEVLAAREVAVDVLPLRDGRTWERKYIPIRNDASDDGHIWVYRDVTREHATLAAAEHRARSAAELLREVSFGLRAQLHTVVGLAELCSEARDLAEARVVASGLRRSGLALLWTLEATLEASREEDVSWGPFDPIATLEDVAVALGAIARERGVALIVALGREVPQAVIGVQQRFRHILTNLLAAVIEARPTGRAELPVSLDLHPRDGLVVRVEAAADGEFLAVGVGMPVAADLARRTGARLSTTERGIELAFPVVPSRGPPVAPRCPGVRVGLAGEAGPATEALGRLVERLGGAVVGPAGLDAIDGLGGVDVLVVAERPADATRIAPGPRGADGRDVPVVWVGEGGLVHPITLDALAEALGRALGHRPPTAGSAAAMDAPRVLVVEDSPANAAVIEAMLARAGYAAHVRETVAAGIAAFAEDRWGLVLVDLDLPDGTGDAAARAMRAIEAAERRPRTPIVACTAQVTPEARARCRDAGMDGFLAKPLPRDRLVEEARRWLAPRGEVLVVDDGADTRLLYERWLEGLGVPLRHAADGPAALETFERRPATVVLLDVSMPGMDGIEVARRLRALPGGASAGILVVTGHADPEVRRRALAAGADAVLIKPVSRGVLLQAVRPLCAPVEAPAAPAEPVGAPPAARPARPEPAVTLDPDVAELVPDYVEACRAELAPIAAALAAGDYLVPRRVGHRLKGSGASFGFPRVTELGAALELAAAGRDGAGCAGVVSGLVAELDAIAALVAGGPGR